MMKLEWEREVYSEPNYRACPQNFSLALPPDRRLHFSPLLLSRPAKLLASTTHMLTVDDCNCFIFACGTYLLQGLRSHWAREAVAPPTFFRDRSKNFYKYGIFKFTHSNVSMTF